MSLAVTPSTTTHTLSLQQSKATTFSLNLLRPVHTLQASNMVHPILPVVTKNASSQDISKTLNASDNEFQFYYFKLHTHGATPRALLAYADAKWSNIYPGVSISMW